MLVVVIYFVANFAGTLEQHVNSTAINVTVGGKYSCL